MRREPEQIKSKQDSKGTGVKQLEAEERGRGEGGSMGGLRFWDGRKKKKLKILQAKGK